MSEMTSMGGGGGVPAPDPFRFKASSTRPYTKREEDARHPKMLSLAYSLLPRCYPDEDFDCLEARTEGRRDCANVIDECSREAVEEAAKDCIREVSEFISGWRFRDGDCQAAGRRNTGKRKAVMGESELVPLAIVDAGLQQCDRSSAVQHIKRSLECTKGPRSARRPQVVAVLRGQDCLTVQAAFAQIARQCYLKRATRSRRPLFMDALEEWYDSYSSESTSTPIAPTGGEATAGAGEDAPMQRASAAAVAKRRRGPVVVLLEDVEGFDKQVLRDLLNVLAQAPGRRKGGRHTADSRQQQNGKPVADSPRCGRTVPIALVAIASARVGFPMDRLGASAAQQLFPKHFHFPSSLECVEVLYDKLFIQGRLPFSLGSRLLSWMKTSFHDTHLSIGMLAKQVKMAASIHFSRPASYLCLQNCRPMRRSSLQGDCPRARMDYNKHLLVEDSKRMPLSQLQAALPGVPPRLDPDKAVALIGRGLRREATKGLRLWFFHKVWKAILKALCERETGLGELRLAEAVLGRQHTRSTAFGGAGSSAEFHSADRSARLGELVSPMRIVSLLSLSKRSRRFYTELAEVSQALEHLPPEAVKSLLVDLLSALPRPSGVSAGCGGGSGGGGAAAAADTSSYQRPAGRGLDAPAPSRGGGGREEEGGGKVTPKGGVFACAAPRAGLGPAKEKSAAAAVSPEASSKPVSPEHFEEVPRDVIEEMSTSEKVLNLPEQPGEPGRALPKQAADSHANADATGADATPAADGGGWSMSGVPSRVSPAGAMGRSTTTTGLSTKMPAATAAAPAAAFALPTSRPTATKTGRRLSRTNEGVSSTKAAVAPHSIRGLDATEAAYLRRGAERVLRLWQEADREGWAEPSDDEGRWSSFSSPMCGHGGAGSSGAISGSDVIPRYGDGGKSAGSRGNRFVNSALHQRFGAATASLRQASGGSPRTTTRGGVERERGAEKEKDVWPGAPLSGSGGGRGSGEIDGKALRRACLVRELQLLFLHAMGEARKDKLGPGMDLPPPLAEPSSVLAEVHCCHEKDREALEASLCPLARTNVDLGMMSGACKGSSAIVQKRKEMSKDQPVLDICVLYACYRGHGKTIDRSDWFLDFRRELVMHKNKKKKKQNADAAAGKGGIKAGCPGAGMTAGGGGGGIDPDGPAELVARFEHASDQLASMGYVRPLKKGRKQGAMGRMPVGEGPGPKGAVTRLVFSYTMEDGAL